MRFNICCIILLLLFLFLLSISDNIINKGGAIINEELSIEDELELFKKIQLNIENTKKKIEIFDSEISINKAILKKKIHSPLIATTREELFKLNITLKNLIQEKAKAIKLLESSLKQYNILLEEQQTFNTRTHSGGKETITISEEENLEASKKSVTESMLLLKLMKMI